MAQDQDGKWLHFAQLPRDLVDTTRDYKPDHGVGSPKRLRDLVLKLNPKRVLDLGCSAACWSPVFDGCEYYGLDQEEGTLELARNNAPNGTYFVGNGMFLPFEGGFFDLVWTSHVLQHNSHFPEKDKIVREIYRVLKTDGHYLCVENTGEEATIYDKSCTIEGWKLFMVSRGFEFIHYHDPQEFLFKKHNESLK